MAGVIQLSVWKVVLMKYRVSVVIVTYGKRFYLLSQVLNGIIDNPLISEIVLVDNGSEEDLENLCKSYNSQSKIFIVKTGKNIGSAGGYKIGIETAFQRKKADFIWLLDDDNLPEKDCLEKLLLHYEKMGSDKNNCFKAFKYNNKSEIILLEKGYFYFDIPDSFFNFNIVNRIMLWRKQKRISNSFTNVFPVRGVAYSGFLFHIDMVIKNGFPDEKMVLYGDDTEYTLRFIYNGAKIFLCTDCILKDLEISWHHNEYKGSPFLSPQSNIVRSYYGVRNRAYIEKKYLIKNYAIYFINCVIYTFFIIIKTLIFERDRIEILKRIFLFINALKKGWQGRLGFESKYDLKNV